MKRLILAAALAALATAAGAKPATLTAEQMRAFGMQALAQGYADQALGIAEALLTRDVRDSAALTLKAQALRMRGDLPASEAAARDAWATATDAGTRYAAATALAQALSLQNHRTKAQFWLRQAVQNAPNAAARDQALQDFNYVRDQNPLRLQFDASVRPSNNVNGGSKVEFVRVGPFILPLPSSFQSLSGTTWALGVSGQYKLSDSGETQNALTFGTNVQGVVLSQAAEDKAPDLSDADFLYRQLQVGWQRKSALSFARLTTEISLGHSWYGDHDLADSLSAEAAVERPLTTGLNGRLGLSVTRQERLDAPASSSTAWGLQASLAKTVASGDVWQGNLDLSRVVSDDIGTDRKGIGLTLAWQARHAIAGLGLGANLSASYTVYATERTDTKLGLGLTATINQLTYLGFSPVVSLDLAHNDSSIPWFTSDTTALGLSLKSRF